jgi:hypothetical protein
MRSEIKPQKNWMDSDLHGESQSSAIERGIVVRVSQASGMK